MPPDGPITIKVHLPNGRIDRATLDATSVTLARASDGVPSAASVTTSPDGRVLVLRPNVPLEADTRYSFRLTNGVGDSTGTRFVPFEMSFNTGAIPDPAVRFEKVQLPTAADAGFAR